MNKEELMKILPHREDMLLLDEAYLNEDGTATGYYTVKGDEFFLHGHFPGYPVVPGVILCEMVAQSSCVLLAGKAENKTPFYTGINNVKFRSQVRPGDKIEFRCTLTKSRFSFYFISGEAYVDGKLCMQGDFSFCLADKAEGQ